MTEHDYVTTADLWPVTPRSARANRLIAPFSGRDGLIRLDRNEDPVGWPPVLVSEFAERITPELISAYPDPSRLLSHLANWLLRPLDEILLTSGSTEALRLVYETFADESRNTLLINPTYSLYDLYANIAGSDILRVPVPTLHDFPSDAITGAIRQKRPSLVVLANPNQPTGQALSRQTIIDLTLSTADVGAVLVVDEAYHLFGATSSIDLLDQYRHVVIVRTFSKAFGLAGLRLGYLVGSKPMLEKLRRLESAVPPSSLALEGGLWALTNLDAAKSRIQEIIRGREFLFEQLTQRGANVTPSSGNFLLIRTQSEERAQAIVDKARSRGFLIKGPLKPEHIGPCIRITAGPQWLMKQFWDSCQDLFNSRNLVFV